MKNKIFSSFILVLIFSFSISGFAQTEEPKEQTLCPVMGNPINKETYIDYQGQRIYFCCAGCDKTFLKDPEKYFSEFAKNNIVLENVQETCPMSGAKLKKKDVYTDYNSRRIYFCGNGCKMAFEKDPEKHLKNMTVNTMEKSEKKKGM